MPIELHNMPMGLHNKPMELHNMAVESHNMPSELHTLPMEFSYKHSISGFSPTYTATDPNIQIPNYTTYLTDVAQQNLDVNKERSAYTTGATERMAIVKDVKTRSGMTRSYVDSVGAYSSSRTTVRNIVKKILNYQTVKPKFPADSPTPPKRNKGEQSFADYKPTNPELQIGEMTALFTSFDNMNQEMNTLASNISVLVNTRVNLYDGAGGLKERMLAVKSAVRAQYGTSSPEYLSVKGIKV
ncbi:MAG: hypothetical protein Q8K98_02810 [Bacteroidota bacterium]|nr:hypothetical protein [Bacteroidota bacterium]